MAITGGPAETALNAMVTVGILLLAWGFTSQSKHSPLIRIAGWILFSAYWPFQAHKFIEESDDPFNAFLTQWGPLVLLYFAWHEWKSYKWNEEVRSLRWAAGTAAVAAGTFFFFDFYAPAALWLEEFTAWETAIMLQSLFGIDVVANGVNLYCNDPVCLEPQVPYSVTIILACTAIQSIMIFVGAVMCVEAPMHRKIRALLVAVPIIHVLNLFRNAGIVYGYKVLSWNPFNMGPTDPITGTQDLFHGSFVWMHSYIGKFGSLGALIVIALAVFIILPELHQSILDLWDLVKRKGPGFFEKRKDAGSAKATKPAASLADNAADARE